MGGEEQERADVENVQQHPAEKWGTQGQTEGRGTWRRRVNDELRTQ